jgi:hypothetical protein
MSTMKTHAVAVVVVAYCSPSAAFEVAAAVAAAVVAVVVAVAAVG